MLFLLVGCLINKDVYERRLAELTDADGDGFAMGDECDDDGAAVFPGAAQRVAARSPRLSCRSSPCEPGPGRRRPPSDRAAARGDAPPTRGGSRRAARPACRPLGSSRATVLGRVAWAMEEERDNARAARLTVLALVALIAILLCWGILALLLLAQAEPVNPFLLAV